MKKQNNKVFTAACGIILVAVVLITFAGSCSKSNPNAVFIGTYYGTQTITGLSPSPDTMVMTAGSSSSAVIILSRGGAGGSVTITVTGGTSVISGTGALSGSTFVANWTSAYNGAAPFNVNYTGAKQ